MGVGRTDISLVFYLRVLCASACKMNSRRGAEDAERRSKD